MAVIHQRLQITTIYHSIRGLPWNKATGHASAQPVRRSSNAPSKILLINNAVAVSKYTEYMDSAFKSAIYVKFLSHVMSCAIILHHFVFFFMIIQDFL